MRFFVTEYSTEKELFESLENGVEDYIWLFGCGEETDFTIVNVLIKEAPYIGVGVQMPKSRDYKKFMDCLRNKTNIIDDDDSEYCNGENDMVDKNEPDDGPDWVCFIFESKSKRVIISAIYRLFLLSFPNLYFLNITSFLLHPAPPPLEEQKFRSQNKTTTRTEFETNISHPSDCVSSHTSTSMRNEL